MSYDGRSIANLVLDYADQAGWEVTNLKLQKLVYFCHVWSWIELERPLIRHSFEAWQNGPVLPYLYKDFKEFGSSPITSRALALNPKTGLREPAKYALDATTQELLKRVLNFYCRLSAHTLVTLTHAKNGPWHKVWHHQDRIRPGMKIGEDDIRGFYTRIPPPVPIQ